MIFFLQIDGQKDIVLCDQLISAIDLVCSFKEMKVSQHRLLYFFMLTFDFCY